MHGKDGAPVRLGIRKTIGSLRSTDGIRINPTPRHENERASRLSNNRQHGREPSRFRETTPNLDDERCHGSVRTAAMNFDTADRTALELLDHHGYGIDPPIGKKGLANALGKCLDEIDMAL